MCSAHVFLFCFVEFSDDQKHSFIYFLCVCLWMCVTVYQLLLHKILKVPFAEVVYNCNKKFNDSLKKCEKCD